MEGYPVFSDAVRYMWLKPPVLPQLPSSTHKTSDTNATQHQQSSVGSSPLDHIQGIAQWYVQTNERLTTFHQDVPVLSSRTFLVGNNNLRRPPVSHSSVGHHRHHHHHHHHAHQQQHNLSEFFEPTTTRRGGSGTPRRERQRGGGVDDRQRPGRVRVGDEGEGDFSSSFSQDSSIEMAFEEEGRMEDSDDDIRRGDDDGDGVRSNVFDDDDDDGADEDDAMHHRRPSVVLQ